MIKVSNINPGALIKFMAGATALVKGQLVVNSSNTAVAGAASISTATIIGVVADDAVLSTVANIYPVAGVDLEIDYYTGGTIVTFADTDIGENFDFNVTSGEFAIDPNLNTGPMLLIRYNNTTKKAFVKIINSCIYCS